MKSPRGSKALSVPLPQHLRDFVASEVERRGHGSADEFIRELIRRAQDDVQSEELEAKLLRSLQSGKPIPMTKRYWAAKRAKLVNGRPRARRA